MASKRIYYGWILVGVGLFCYGFGISPAYYSFGFFGPELREELGLTSTQTGSVFGIFQFVFSAVGPLVGIAIARFGLRATMTTGALTCAVGFYLLSRADSVADCYLAYAIIGGLGIGFSTILPCQVLATYWFQKYRARAMAIIFTGGALVGMAVNPFNSMFEGGDWRNAWVIIAAMSVIVAVVAAIFIRTSPGDMDLQIDGLEPSLLPLGPEPGQQATNAQSAKDSSNKGPVWTAAQALRTPQFFVITLTGLAYSLPWGVVTAHGGEFVRGDLAIPAAAAGFILGTARVGASAVGRMSASVGDFMSPPRVLGIALIIEAAGIGTMAMADSQPLLYLGVILLGLGFGTAYLSIPLVFGLFFGQKAFATTTGTRIMINGVFGYLAPTLSGAFHDQTGSFVPVFWTLAGISLVGAFCAFIVKPPRPPLGNAAQSQPA